MNLHASMLRTAIELRNCAYYHGDRTAIAESHIMLSLIDAAMAEIERLQALVDREKTAHAN